MTDRPYPLQRTLRRVTPPFRRDVRPIVVGLLVTFAFTVVFHFAGRLFPAEALQAWLFEQTGTYHEIGNPLAPLQFLGGLVGGGVAGYCTGSAWIDGGVNGLVAGVLGIATVYAAWAGVRAIEATVVWGMVPPPPIEVFLFPMIVLFPYVTINLITGFVGGAIGYVVG